MTCQYSDTPTKRVASKSIAGVCCPLNRQGASSHKASFRNSGKVWRKHSRKSPVPRRMVSPVGVPSRATGSPFKVVLKPLGIQGSGSTFVSFVKYRSSKASTYLCRATWAPKPRNDVENTLCSFADPSRFRKRTNFKSSQCSAASVAFGANTICVDAPPMSRNPYVSWLIPPSPSFAGSNPPRR